MNKASTILGVITAVVAVVGILYGPGIIDRFAEKTLVLSATDSELILPPGVRIVASDPAELIPDSVISFRLSNETGFNCSQPIFRLTVTGNISRLVITDTKEKKELIQASVKYDDRRIQRDTVRFESDRIASGSFVSGILWYKLSAPRQPLDSELSSNNNFTLKMPGEQRSNLPAQILLGLTAVATALFVATLQFKFRRMLKLRRAVRPVKGVFKTNVHGYDFVGPGHILGASGTPDLHITLEGLASYLYIKDIEIRSSVEGGIWRSWADRPDAPNNWIVAYCESEEFNRDPNTPKLTNLAGQTHRGLSDIELFFEPFAPLPGASFTVEVLYTDGRKDSCEVSQT